MVVTVPARKIGKLTRTCGRMETKMTRSNMFSVYSDTKEDTDTREDKNGEEESDLREVFHYLQKLKKL